jgi:hypothetical protein
LVEASARPLKLSLQIFDREPVLHPQRGGQVWKGGATDLATRRAIEHPARWLVLADYEAGSHRGAAIDAETPIFAWDLEQILPGRQQSPATAGGVILVSMDVDPQREDEFKDWYNTEHIPLFLKVPGVIAGRRFRAVTGKPTYVALYHVDDTGVYATQAWMAVNTTPWILRLRKFQRNRTYFMFGTLMREE